MRWKTPGAPTRRCSATAGAGAALAWLLADRAADGTEVTGRAFELRVGGKPGAHFTRPLPRHQGESLLDSRFGLSGGVGRGTNLGTIWGTKLAISVPFC